MNSSLVSSLSSLSLLSLSPSFFPSLPLSLPPCLSSCLPVCLRPCLSLCLPPASLLPPPRSPLFSFLLSRSLSLPPSLGQFLRLSLSVPLGCRDECGMGNMHEACPQTPSFTSRRYACIHSLVVGMPIALVLARHPLSGGGRERCRV